MSSGDDQTLALAQSSISEHSAGPEKYPQSGKKLFDGIYLILSKKFCIPFMMG